MVMTDVRRGISRSEFAIIGPIAALFFAVAGPAVGDDGQKTSPPPSARADSFAIDQRAFLLNGKPFQIISGEMHYARIPRAYWRQRLRMARAMGLNTIATYVFWNVHEPEKDKWNFSGDADLAAFVRAAREEGLYVLLRVGPYACGEWEFGGYPYWLLNETTDDKPMVIRSADPNFLKLTGRYLDRIGAECASLQADRGGNILMVQVENEYGSFGKDKVYMAAIRDQIRHAGFTVPLYTADGPGQMPNGDIEGALPALDGAGANNLAATVDTAHPGGPYFASEVYPGWLDHWGEPFNRYRADAEARMLTSFVKKGFSVNLYMFHGGTNFGWMNGANMGSTFEPSITSYDYGAPLDEAGQATPMYTAMRDALATLLPSRSIPPVPAPPPVIAIPRFTLSHSGSLFGALPRPVRSDAPRTMESLNQDFGYVLYRTHIAGPKRCELKIQGLRDYAVVCVNGKFVGTLDRRHKQQSIALDVPVGDCVLDLLVENEGRINYGGQIRDNHKGITGAVTLDGAALSTWENFSLPLRDPTHLALDGKAGSGPTVYSGVFSVDTIGDTFLDVRGWTKGVVWVNGHNLGRYWYVGPQQTLYVPGPWLHKGTNSICILEEVKTDSASIAGLSTPILDQVVPEPHVPAQAVAARPKWRTPPRPTPADSVVSGDFTDGTSTQTVMFPQVLARYVCFESTSAWDGSAFASCAEFNLLDAHGKPLSRAAWRIAYADSEETQADDNKAENMIDDDDGTFWHSLWGSPYTGHPHYVVIDLGATATFSGFRYEPRQSGQPGRIKGYRFYAAATEFGAL